MAKSFITEDWLLATKTARRLYHDYAAGQPIFDYHNHLPPAQIATDHHFDNLHEAWLAGDHYKWRAMRVHGVEERLITGAAGPEDKFVAYAGAVPYAARNPLYHWSHLELKRYFGVEDRLDGSNAVAVYQNASAQLRAPGKGAIGLLREQNVRLVCTTDDPVHSLEHHARFAASPQASDLTMLPAFRPDNALLAQKPGWRSYLRQLADVSGVEITDYASLLSALEQRMGHFATHGCALADHGLQAVPAAQYRPEAGDRLLKPGAAAGDRDAADFLFTLLTDLGRAYARRGWVMQLHLGAQRNNNRRAERELGPDTGYDSIGDRPQAAGLARLLDGLNDTDELPKTILYNLNPADNHVFATMAGNYCGGPTVAKVQWGAAWWFLDQWDGMETQLNTLSQVGLLAHFVGMLTDSRSFLSFPRHEYFRRLLCNLLGQDVAAGRLPDDEAWLGGLVKGICYGNAASWFPFRL